MISVIALLLGCGEKTSEDPAVEDTASEDTGSETEAPDFVGMDFLLESSEGYQPVSENISLGFPGMNGDAIEFQFHAACNGMGGSFLFEDGVVNMQEISMTEMGCEQELMEEDDWFVNFWNSGPSLSLAGDLLTVSDGENSFYFRDAEVVTPDLPLVDTHWVIDTFIDGDAASNFINLESDPWVEFRSDGSISLDTGCNSGAGSYSLDGSTILVTMEYYTEAACVDEMGQEAESHIVTVFMDNLEYSIDASRIHLMGATKGVSGTAQ